MHRLYSDKKSGNCFKARLIMHLTGQDFETVEVDILKGATQSDDFLNMNPVGKVPTLVLDDGRVLSESNAILVYFAQKTPLMPEDPFDQALVHQWLFWEQYSHETAIAVARFTVHYLHNTADTDPRLPGLWQKGNVALKIMNDHLETRDFFVADKFSIADIALFAYTHVAEEGGFSLSHYPNIENWIKRVESVEGFLPMEAI